MFCGGTAGRIIIPIADLCGIFRLAHQHRLDRSLPGNFSHRFDVYSLATDEAVLEREGDAVVFMHHDRVARSCRRYPA